MTSEESKQTGVPDNDDEAVGLSATCPQGPSVLRAVIVLTTLVTGFWLLSQWGRTDQFQDNWISQLGRIEVTARLVQCPEEFPDLGAYRYTYVVEYEVLEVHRPDPDGQHDLKPGDSIYVGHYKPRQPRGQIRDDDWGTAPLGGTLDVIKQGDVHRMALDYELATLAPSGALDYCYPPNVNRFFAIWTNRAGQ